jgi:hypothetical protein
MPTLRRLLGHDLLGALADDAEHLRPVPSELGVVTEAEITALPETVRRYLRFMDVVGRPRDRSFRANMKGRFRAHPKMPWMPFVAWQYNTAHPVSRLFHMRIDVLGVVPMVGRDAYLGGTGAMRGALFGVVPVVHGDGNPYDVSELTTWMNDALLLAPSMLLAPTTEWTAVDESSFDVTVHDHGRDVTGRLYVDHRGAPKDFSTTDRFVSLPSGVERAEWRTPVDSFEIVDHRPSIGAVCAVWRLSGGRFPYVEARLPPHAVHYNVPARAA